jgi:hypothetical protein
MNWYVHQTESVSIRDSDTWSGKVTVSFPNRITHFISHLLVYNWRSLCLHTTPHQIFQNLFQLLNKRQFGLWLRVSLGRNNICRYSHKLGVFLVSFGHPCRSRGPPDLRPDLTCIVSWTPDLRPWLTYPGLRRPTVSRLSEISGTSSPSTIASYNDWVLDTVGFFIV